MWAHEVLVRVFLEPEALEPSIAFYETLFGQRCGMRLAHPDAGLKLARVGQVLLIAGSAEDLEPFRATTATFLVETLEDLPEFLEERGAEILSPPQKVPTGRNLRARHPDGLVVEYVELRK